MHKLSVVIITFNEEHNIGRCIDSVKTVADEIIVLDSFSTDRTVEIASGKGAIIKQERFNGYIEQKNLALSLASFDYVLSLDADEALDEKLKASILQAKQKFIATGYTMNRCTSLCGHFIKHGQWYPDKKLRLFDKRTARWDGINPHDKVYLLPTAAVQHLRGDILHYSFDTLEDYIQQGNVFTTISARELYKKGKRVSFFRILINPAWTFIHGYCIRLGFLDGYYGFVIAVNSAHHTFLKYIKIYNLQQTEGIR